MLESVSNKSRVNPMHRSSAIAIAASAAAIAACVGRSRPPVLPGIRQRSTAADDRSWRRVPHRDHVAMEGDGDGQRQADQPDVPESLHRLVPAGWEDRSSGRLQSGLRELHAQRRRALVRSDRDDARNVPARLEGHRIPARAGRRVGAALPRLRSRADLDTRLGVDDLRDQQAIVPTARQPATRPRARSAPITASARPGASL